MLIIHLIVDTKYNLENSENKYKPTIRQVRNTKLVYHRLVILSTSTIIDSYNNNGSTISIIIYKLVSVIT